MTVHPCPELHDRTLIERYAASLRTTRNQYLGLFAVAMLAVVGLLLQALGGSLLMSGLSVVVSLISVHIAILLIMATFAANSANRLLETAPRCTHHA